PACPRRLGPWARIPILGRISSAPLECLAHPLAYRPEIFPETRPLERPVPHAMPVAKHLISCLQQLDPDLFGRSSPIDKFLEFSQQVCPTHLAAPRVDPPIGAS